ncbi:hypothetical protein AOLI_G00050760 [Acnodon oligacanthus]
MGAHIEYRQMFLIGNHLKLSNCYACELGATLEFIHSIQTTDQTCQTRPEASENLAARSYLCSSGLF